MIQITSLIDGLDLFKALGSDVRIQILNVLLKNKNMTMNQLASELSLSNGAITGHIRKLEECGLISTSNESTAHGNSKVCSIIQDKILIDIERPVDYTNVVTTDIKVGQYSSYEVAPTCGLATSESVVGEVDDIRYFAHPDRFSADIVWFSEGYVEYIIPNLVPQQSRITQFSLSLELSSEAPGVENNWPSDITFYLNGRKLAMWTSPGDFGGDTRGHLTPDWWPPVWNQYGIQKLIVVNKYGTYIDGLKISDNAIDVFQLDRRSNFTLRIAVEKDSVHVGGLTLFGKTFGNYSQDIHISLSHTPEES